MAYHFLVKIKNYDEGGGLKSILFVIPYQYFEYCYIPSWFPRCGIHI